MMLRNISSLTFLIGVFAAPSSLKAQAGGYCWTCLEYEGCALVNWVVIGYSACTTQYYPIEGCWLYPPECYTWIEPPRGSIDSGPEGRLSLDKSAPFLVLSSHVCEGTLVPDADQDWPDWVPMPRTTTANDLFEPRASP
jgi:hypothetical protein